MSNNVIWTIEGNIKDGEQDALRALMTEMVETVHPEVGTLNYEWTLGEDGRRLHVYERYRDAEATTLHLGTWAKFAPRFMALVDVTRFSVFSDLTPALREAVAGMDPVYMKPIGGFAKPGR